MNNLLTVGSLFDGSGSFPVAGILLGIKPIWKSEIELFLIDDIHNTKVCICADIL